MRKSKYDYIHNDLLYRVPPILLAQSLQMPVRTVYTLRNNRLRHGKANEVIRDLLHMADLDFIKRYHVRKRAMRKGWNRDND